MGLKEKVIVRSVIDYMKIITIALIAAVFVRVFFVQAYKIPTGSMEDTLLAGDFLIVNKVIYGVHIPFTSWRLPGFSDPEPGDIIVFKYPEDRSIDYIKRCIAVAGQTVEIRDKVVYVDDDPFPIPPHARSDNHVMTKGVPAPGIFPPGRNFNPDNYGPVTVPDGHLFVMGDNRDNSMDSRYWGFLNTDDVIGKALVIYWSVDKHIPLRQFVQKVRWRRIADVIQ